MTSCAQCGQRIVFGGTRVEGLNFCSARCERQGALLIAARRIPDHEVEPHLARLYRSPCPRCHGPGPLDVQRSHRVWSLLVLTRRRTRSLLACRACGRRQAIEALLFSALCGWWGLPWGVIWTPLVIARNLRELRGSEPDAPSQALRDHLRLHLAASRATGAPQAG
ncbi:MAG: hypothetical protein U1F56_18710 [Rubrivivax sp.]